MNGSSCARLNLLTQTTLIIGLAIAAGFHFANACFLDLAGGLPVPYLAATKNFWFGRDVALPGRAEGLREIHEAEGRYFFSAAWAAASLAIGTR